MRDGIATAQKELEAATARFRAAADWQAELPALVAAFETLDQAADGDYKSRMAFNKLSGYSKAWGGAVNLFANANAQEHRLRAIRGSAGLRARWRRLAAARRSPASATRKSVGQIVP